MKKFIHLSLLLTTIVFGQNSEIKAELPTVIPPSPTVAALMKFEEVPVSNYTGIPDISIPLFSSPTHSKDIAINLALKYHAGVGAYDVASDVGLGWSLFAGGSISRTVRGLPDEVLDYTPQNTKIGIYHNNLQHFKNNYYDFNQNFTSTDKRDYLPNTISAQDSLMVNKFLWETKELNRFDTEHDLWQFNFMGQSGRFYIKKNLVTNLLEIIPLDDYRISINYNYGTVYNNPYTPISFIIYDEKGYQYIFDVIETTFSHTAILDSWGGSANDRFSTSFEKENISAIHLSKIFDNNSQLLVEFEYTNIGEYYDLKVDKYLTRNQFPYNFEYNMLASQYNINNEIKPQSSQISTFKNNRVRKIKKIKSIGISEILFNYGFQRSDNNLQNGYALSEIQIKNINNIEIKKFIFDYSYSTIYNEPYNEIFLKRLLLRSVKDLSLGLNSYELDYYDQVFDGFNVGSDYWGYLNLIPSCAVDNHLRKYPSPEFSTRDLLKKIKYPTTGCTIFNFESNTYSFEGENEIQSLYQDDQNIQFSNSTTYNFNNYSNILNLGILSNNYKKLVFYSSLNISDVENTNRIIYLEKKLNNNWTSAGISLGCNNETCCIEFYPETNIEYRVKYSNLDIFYNGTETISISYFTPNLVNQFLKGGGNRIKKIAYYDKNVEKNYDGSGIVKPIKLLNYIYTQPNNSNKSSGSLVYVKPKYKSERSFSFSTEGACYQPLQETSVFYISETSQNIFSGLKTQGAEVGYKYVSVVENNNGGIDYQYTSPIDFPEEIEVSEYFDHIPSKNIDFKRGLLINETIYNKDDRILKTTNYTYDFYQRDEQTGLRFLKSYMDTKYQGTQFEYIYENLKFKFDNNENYLQLCDPNGNSIGHFLRSPITLHNAYPLRERNLILRPIIEAYGWSKLTNKISKSYFYPNGSSTPNITQTSETYTYNPVNKQLAENTVTNSKGETLKTKYFYHTGNSPYSQNRIAEIESIETYRGAELLSKSKVNYGNSWQNNVSLLPQTIESTKGSNNLESRVEYIQYDAFSNPLEMKQTSGMHITYIWGYNKTQPIAKIENATYAQVQQYEANLQTLSNGTDEASLLTALDNLRTALPNAMVTTYTYKPLVGVSTITDPKGNKITYHYDSFNRLEFVKDQDGNILSENKYHYKN